MAKSKSAAEPPPMTPPASPPAGYTVVARRYRPQQFADLIGQEHVSAALVNALQTGRVAHAYLFTGARGVGKTSAARILAKALNCVQGPTPTPCDRCESCLAVAAGQDMDVLEIDGASNNGVDQIRELRQNAGLRPSRGRNKIYVIDEVHMLSTSAFNALLKTLEEPPPHVKFILATTEVPKIPVTILSRCQRFDFAQVGPGKIFTALKRIVTQEGLKADDDALRLVARRAAGSMRDSQSLLDQLLAASPDGTITAEQVHATLGTAADERVIELAAAVLDKDSAKALELVAASADQGLQTGELTDQLIDYWRSLMLVGCGGPNVRELPVGPNQKEVICRQAGNVSLDSILAGLEVWTGVKGRMRGSSYTQVLLEMAVVRLCRLDELVPLAQLTQALTTGETLPATPSTNGPARPPAVRLPEAPPVKKNSPLTPVATEPAKAVEPVTDKVEQPLPLSKESLPQVWSRVSRYLEEKAPILAKALRDAKMPAIFGPNSLAIRFAPDYSSSYDFCCSDRQAERLSEAFRQVTGTPATVKFDLDRMPSADDASQVPAAPAAGGDRKKELLRLPLFRRAADVLAAQVWHVDDDFTPVAPLAGKVVVADDDDDDASNPDDIPEEG